MKITMSDWRARAASKRNETLAKIPQDWILPEVVLEAAKKRRAISGEYIESLLDERTRSITNTSNDHLLHLMGNGNLSATEVVGAFCKRAAYAHQLNNSLLEIAFDSAMEKARELDSYYQEHRQLVGPLHGIPYSMKDQWHIKGLDTSMAYVGWLGTQGGRPRGDDENDLNSQLVEDLSMLGAVPIAKTTLMQTTWSGETDNNILGYLWNPNVSGLSAGGSSGGEGALHSLRGSAFGFGTDIGGSVSMPAAANGVYSLKPSYGRISMKGTVVSSPGQMLIPMVAGIFGHSIGDIRHVFQALLTTKPWLRDPELLPIPFRNEECMLNQQLTFGLFPFDGVARPHPPIARAMQIVARALTLGGHDLLSWAPPSHAGVEELHSSVSSADGQLDIFERTTLSGEPFRPSLDIDEDDDQPSPSSIFEYYDAAQKLQSWRSEYAAYWNSTARQTKTGRPVDAIIMPVGTQVAPRPGKVYHYGYSCVVNVLDYCSAVVPLASVDQAVDVFDSNYQPVSEKDMRTWRAYDASIYHGAPIAIQVICRRLEEEKLLSITQIIVEALASREQIPQ